MSNVTGVARPPPNPSLLSASRMRLETAQQEFGRRSPLRAHIFVMGLLFLAAVIVGYTMLPGDAERIAMLERDGKTAEARQILEQQFANGDRRQRTLYLLEGLYEQSGNLPKARQTLELLAQQRPRDANLQRQLGQFYRVTDAEPEYIRALQAQIDARYSEPACRELIGLLRRKGSYGPEQEALQKCRQKGYRRPEDMVRLASLMAAGGELKEASQLLRAVDDLRRLKSDRERLQLFELLLEVDQPGEAQRRAVRWAKATKDDSFTLTLIGELASANRQDLAIELARDTSVPGDSVFLAVPEMMVDRDELTAARAMLQGWLDKATDLDPPLTSRFIAASLSAGDTSLAFAGARKAGLETLAPESAGRLVRALEAGGRHADADAIRQAVSKAQGVEVPDQSEAREGGRIAGGEAAAKPGSNLDPWRSALWKRLRDENKIIGPNVPIVKSRQSRELTALKRARRARYVRRFAQPKPPKAGQAPAGLLLPPFTILPKL